MLKTKNLETVIIDGELFCLPNSEQLKQLLRGELLDGVGLARLEDTSYWSDFVHMHDGLVLGLHKGAPLRGGWWYGILSSKQGKYFRVNIQRESCSYCNWDGWIGNPVNWDIYIGSPDDLGALESARNYPKLSCPCCHNNLNSHAIWLAGISKK